MPVQVSQVTHNNNAHFYRIAIDIAKEGTEVWDLTPYFKGRVGDDNFGLQIVWYYQGRLLDVTNKTPYIKGNVGHYSFDDKKNLQMAADADVVVSHGNPNDCQANGQVTYYFPQQMFPTDGVFKGFIGLEDENQNLTGVDIWFRVLPGVAQMGRACDFYVDILDKTIANFKEKIRQQSIDFDTVLNQELQKEKDLIQQKLDAAGDAIDEDTATLKKLAAAVGAIQAQINAGNVITRAEYNDLATKINNTLAGMDLHPETFASENDLKSKYPAGAEGLKVTADTMHKWLYINGSWTDEGPYTFNDLSPKEKAVLYAHSSDNVLINPDLQNNAYGWKKSGQWDEDPAHSIGSSMAYGVNLSDQMSSFYQEDVNVQNHKAVSAGIQVLTVGIPSGVNFQLLFKDANGQIINNAVYNVPIPTDTANSFKLVSIEHVTVPNTAMTAAVTVAGKGKGLLIICRPQLNFASTLVPYSILEMDQNKDQGQDNILTNPDLRRDAYGWGITGPWQTDPAHSIGNSMAYGLNLTEDQTTNSSFYQENINVKGRATASAGVHVLTVKAEGAHLQLLFKDKAGQIIDGSIYNVALPADTDNRYRIVKIEGVKVPANAVTAALTVATKNKGLIIICRPQLNCQTTLVPYSTQEIDEVSRTYRQSSDNALINPDLKHYADGWSFAGPWQVDPAHSIGNSIAYGLYLTDKPASTCSFYQENINVEKRGIASAGIRVMTVNASGASFQLLFKDKNGQIITTDVYNQTLPSNTNNVFDTLSFMGIKVPDNAKTAALTVSTSGTGLIIICRPQLNFADHLVPYSFSDVDTSKAKHLLPYFNFGTGAANVQNDWVNTSFSYIEDDRKIDGYAQIAIQGDSSRTYPKKNYKIKLFSDAGCKTKLNLRLKPSWPETNKLNLKANWIDATQSRNLASAKLVAAATAVTPIADSTVESHLAKTSNFGQIEGFPIEIYFNGAYNGLYTCNTKKDDKVFGLDADQADNAAISILNNAAQSDTQLLSVPTAKLDNVAYADELHDTPDAELVTNWTKWLQFLNTATDDDFKANLASYIDIKSAINLYLFGVMSREYDYYTKSVLYLTWNNGKYFYLIPYDLDSNWGQSADGKIEGNPTNDSWTFSTDNSGQDGKYVSNLNWNKLFERLYKLFMPEIKEQYTYLRSSVWRTDQLLNAYRDFMNQIPEAAYEKDHKLWTQIPSLKTNDYEQLHQVIVRRSNQMDRWIKSK